MVRIGILIAALLGTSQSAMAQGESHCNIPFELWSARVAPELDGFWHVTSLVGTLQVAGRVMPLPAGEPSTGGITVQDSAMTISSDIVAGEYLLEWVDPEQKWDFTPGPNVPVDTNKFLDDERLAVLAGCEDVNTLPRLRAVGSFAEGADQIDFELLLYVVKPDLLYGVTIGTLNGGEGIARRILTISR